MSNNVKPAKPAKKEKKIINRAENFKRIGSRRLVKAIAAIRSLGKLASRNYVFTEGQVDIIVKTLNTEIATIAEKFRNVLKKGPTEKEKIEVNL